MIYDEYSSIRARFRFFFYPRRDTQNNFEIGKKDTHLSFLNIYFKQNSDGLAAALSEQLMGKKIDGIWHTSIHVHGKEYWFGHGMQVGIPRKTQFGQPKEVLQMGETEVDEEGFQEYLEKLQPRYNVGTYNLTNHNCNNFSDEVCEFLVGKNIPEDIVSLPSDVLDTEFGQAIKPMLEVFENRMKNTKGHHVSKKDATMLDKKDATMLDKKSKVRCKKDKDTKQFPEEDRDYCEERVKQLREQMYAELKPLFAVGLQALVQGLANNGKSAAPGLPHQHHHTSM